MKRSGLEIVEHESRSDQTPNRALPVELSLLDRSGLKADAGALSSPLLTPTPSHPALDALVATSVALSAQRLGGLRRRASGRLENNRPRRARRGSSECGHGGRGS